MSAALKLEDNSAALMDTAGEALTAREWAELLGLTDRSVRLAMEQVQPETRFVRGGLAKVYRFADLPPFYRAKLETLRAKHVASSYSSLISMRHVETRWVPDRAWMSYPEATRDRALKKKAVAQVYFAALDNGRQKQEANLLARAEWLRQFGEPGSFNSIRRLEALVETRGGIDFAPLEAYCDGKSTPHVMARRQHKLGIPEELIAEFKARTVQEGMEHISSAFRSLELDWNAGRAVAGLGRREGARPFPYKLSQFRAFAASTAARRQGSHGKARARREALPAMRTSTANLRRAELYLLDDSRLDIIATDDLTGRPVECRLYWMIDVGPRRIEGFVLREMGHIKANDVDTLVTRVLRSSGLAALGAGYKTRVKFEGGTVSCSPARKSLLLGSWPAQLEIDSTSMDGGKNHPGAPVQSGSGHWMGKAHIESFMRTVSFFLEHLPGQRGGTFRRQPAQLGLQGRDRESGYLNYHLGSSLHEAALLEYGNRALEWIETGEVASAPEGGVHLRRLKVSALHPVSWIQHAIQEFIAYYNGRTDHRMEGFDRIEYKDPETGAKKWRMESPHERALALDRQAPTVRIPASDAAFLLTHDAKPKTVRAGGSSPGLTMDIAPWKGLRFWHEGSKACHEASLLATTEKQYTVVYDREAIRLWTPESDYTPEVHLLTEAPGKPGSRWLETLPLASYGDRTDAESMAAELEKVKRAEKRHTAELVRAAAPALARRTAEAQENISTLRGTITVLDQLRATAEPSGLITDIRAGRPVETGEPTRAGQMDGAAAELARFQAEHLPAPVAPATEDEPEIF